MQDFAFVKLNDICIKPFLQCLKVLLNSSLIQHIDHFLLFDVVCKTADRAHYAIIQVAIKEIKLYWLSTNL